MELGVELKNLLEQEGAVLVGYGALTAVPAHARADMPVGVSVAVKYPKWVIKGIAEGPTDDYFAYYNSLNVQLDRIVQGGADFLSERGYRALACTRANIGDYSDNLHTRLPHKTVATRAGLGWIGKCALLVTEEFGSMIRISSLLTDAPLPVAATVDASLCGACTACQNACPAHAVRGGLWDISKEREAFFDADACHNTMRRRSKELLNKELTICGKCIEICPHTKRYLANGYE